LINIDKENNEPFDLVISCLAVICLRDEGVRCNGVTRLFLGSRGCGSQAGLTAAVAVVGVVITFERRRTDEAATLLFLLGVPI